MKLHFLRPFVFFMIFGLIFSCTTQQRNRHRHHSVKKTQTQSKPQSQKEEKEEPKPEAVKIVEAEKKVAKKDENPLAKTETIPTEPEIKVELPEVRREFRAAWIASVANINWPSKRGLTVEQQKEEAIQILDVLKENNFNAVILQVRPSADALYDSPNEPWSIFLTGENGKEPKPYYDPLEFWIQEAHKRGLELHAWLNPYRAHHTNGGKVSSSSMVNQMPNEIVRLANGMYWFDPGLKETQDHVSTVVKDIVKRYDVDGIHFDDYFYPYKSYNNNADFPDSKSWNIYKNSGGKLSKDDWRRDNVNNFIQRIYTEIKTEKNWVKFGISPFGIWKPGYPSGISGMSQYDELYADAKLWLNKGWVDYFTPQLYWPIDAPKQGFVSLLNWWQSENTYKRHLWPGLNTVEIKTADRPTEIIRQIESNRQLIPDDSGVVHWSMAGLDSRMLSSLRKGPYHDMALIPASKWLNPIISGKPKLKIENENNEIKANWSFDKPEQVRQWILYFRYDDSWGTEILDAEIKSKKLPKTIGNKVLNMIAIKAVDRLSNESDYKALKIIE